MEAKGNKLRKLQKVALALALKVEKTKNLNTEGNFEKPHFQNAAENRVRTQYWNHET